VSFRAYGIKRTCIFLAIFQKFPGFLHLMLGKLFLVYLRIY